MIQVSRKNQCHLHWEKWHTPPSLTEHAELKIFRGSQWLKKEREREQSMMIRCAYKSRQASIFNFCSTARCRESDCKHYWATHHGNAIDCGAIQFFFPCSSSRIWSWGDFGCIHLWNEATTERAADTGCWWVHHNSTTINRFLKWQWPQSNPTRLVNTSYQLVPLLTTDWSTVTLLCNPREYMCTVLVFFLLLGCGTGNYTVALSGYVGKVIGLEVNEGMLGRAMEKTAALKNVSLTQGDITKMPFQDSQFDGICCNQVNHSYAVILCSLIYMPNLPAFQLL